MSSNKNEDLKLPDGWVQCPSKSNPGRKYFFNKKTGKSSWTKPQADERYAGGNSKQRTKKEKKKQEKSKKEDFPKKSLKRKSDNNEEGSGKKKPREDTQIYDNSKREMRTPVKRPEKQSPSKSLSSSKKGSPTKPLSKNIANSRLSQLRAQLNIEAEKEESSNLDNSPQRVNLKRVSPNSTQTEMQIKMAKIETQNLLLNDSKCTTTTPSPSSDGVQSASSPSQFFAANKIISSMKAQLPDQYCEKSTQKNTFADIEEGICNQTPEYPFLKHPATPPQFSEASKLMSAIKSKLSYKMPAKDTSVTNFSSAQDRMNNLRNRLSSEIGIDNDISIRDRVNNENVYSGEAMDVDYVHKEVTSNAPPVQCTKNSGTNNNENVVLVVDTNVFIHELDFIKNVLNSHIKGYSEPPTLLVPWRVINELDRLKDNNNGNGAICKRAKSAMDYLYKSLPENDRIKGQSLRDANSHIYPCELPDDEILNCCLQQSERGNSVILLSNDKNLCSKAVVNGVSSVPLAALRPRLAPRAAAPRAARAALQRHRAALHHLLANILENEMRAKYNNLWQHVLFKAPPWTLSDVLQCLLKHWIAVFNDVFPRIEHLITDLRNALVSIESKDPECLTQSEVSNFMELCVEVAKKCQIIPEYMDLAKRTLERMQRPPTEPTAVQAFEALCSKLSPGQDAAEGMVSVDRLQFAARARALSRALQRVVNTDSVSDDQVLELEAAVREGLTLIGVDCAVTAEDLRSFCTNCGNMLQEAYTKFTQLTEVLDTCQSSISNV
ncbi:transcriptional protein SWT1 isoform X2 [Galleria mellonella]|uniref:Transcriptional protein SWT1 isoform X2 n=1 Tax=Galleria mellonella TaxID=7137 RepID=A0A6J3BQT4_GALME|nr:transcriptional protein SWT1 isoform X2 [Galleria mellonella]